MHIENILTCVAKVVGIMRRLKFKFTRAALNQIYLSYVLPILEYSSVVLGWMFFTRLKCVRRKQQKLNFMYRSVNGLVPTYITDLIPPVIRETTNYPLRNQTNITTPFCRMEIFRKTCIPSGIALWNSLHESLRNSSTLNPFKYQMKRELVDVQKVPLYYIYGDRYLSVMHSRIRNNCSNLSDDFYLNHLTMNPLCSCNQEIENAEQFFFRCLKYANERLRLFHETRVYHRLNNNLILFGDERLSFESNIMLFRAVQNYIKNTKIFAN